MERPSGTGVWTFSKLSKDISAIYSFVDMRAEHTKDGIPKRYTVEFCRKTDGKYYVAQVQGRYDRVNAGDMKEYVQSLLDDAQENREKKAGG